jgi:hypothetical protein
MFSLCQKRIVKSCSYLSLEIRFMLIPLIGYLGANIPKLNIYSHERIIWRCLSDTYISCLYISKRVGKGIKLNQDILCKCLNCHPFSNYKGLRTMRQINSFSWMVYAYHCTKTNVPCSLLNTLTD